jgi:predicted DNA-binding transcriptional regulator AlpA
MTQAYCHVCGHNRPHRVRTVEVRNIITVHEVLKTCTTNPRKPTTRANLARWRERNDFPKPFKTVGRRVELWDLAEVRAWWEAWQARRADE